MISDWIRPHGTFGYDQSCIHVHFDDGISKDSLYNQRTEAKAVT